MSHSVSFYTSHYHIKDHGLKSYASFIFRLSSPFHIPKVMTSPSTSDQQQGDPGQHESLSGQELDTGQHELDPTSLSITDEEKQQMLTQAANFSLDNRPFLASLFNCLDYSDNDYFQLFALCLIYAMQVKVCLIKVEY